MSPWVNFQNSLDQRIENINLDNEQQKAQDFSLYGHGLARGVAGSGKSLILKRRYEKLIQNGFNEILVLSYNRFMKGWLKKTVQSQNVANTFHSWAYFNLGYDYNWDKDEETRKQVIQLAKNFAEKNNQYKAILIDEAQDFYDEWFKAILEILFSETNSIFFVYDNTQSVYGQMHRTKSNWTWKSLGFDVQGRSQVFDINYRNSPEILEVAWQYVEPYLIEANLPIGEKLYEYKEDQKINVQQNGTPNISKIIKPRTIPSRSSKIQPNLINLSYNEVPSKVAEEINLALKSYQESSIAVLTHPNRKQIRQEIDKELKQLNIEYHAPTKSRERDYDVVDRPIVLIDSWNAVKGVEFDAVIIIGIDDVEEDNDFEEKAGLYVAMTRARDHLIMLYQNRNETVERIENALNSNPSLRIYPPREKKEQSI